MDIQELDDMLIDSKEKALEWLRSLSKEAWLSHRRVVQINDPRELAMVTRVVKLMIDEIDDLHRELSVWPPVNCDQCRAEIPRADVLCDSCREKDGASCG